MLQDLAPMLEYIRCDTALTIDIENGLCMACGGLSPYEYTEVINPKLAKQWKLTAAERRGMSARESRYCAFCGCSARLRNLALAVSLTYAEDQNTNPPIALRQLIKDGKLDNLAVAEINSCGVLHDILKDIPHLYYSEYAPLDKKVAHQDLMALTYKDESFDLVVNSDTLEHVPDPIRALSEIYRVLKKGGYLIFTVPAFLNKKGRTRVAKDNDAIRYIEPKSYHGSGEPDYLVWNEFGSEFIDTVRSVGFELQVYFLNVARLEDPSYVFVARRPVNDVNESRGLSPKEKHPVMTDPTLLLTDSPSKYIDIQVQGQAADQPVAIDHTVQVELLEGLVRKLQLTQTHAQNLEDIIQQQKITIDKLTKDFKAIEGELKGVYESKAWKLISKAAAAKEKLKGE